MNNQAEQIAREELSVQRERKRQMTYWAYRHINGTIKVEQFIDADSLDAAYESDFVDEILDPFKAESHKQAEQIAREELSVKETL
jgi:hypothetical protein